MHPWGGGGSGYTMGWCLALPGGGGGVTPVVVVVVGAIIIQTASVRGFFVDTLCTIRI